MDTVLGLSVTATNVQTVLVEGRDGDGATLGHDEFDAFADVSAARASEQVAEAVLSIASADGHHLHSIGVTWSEDADLEASLLLDSLADLGLANVVAVQSPRAAEALAASIGRMIGYQRTAVCVIEPDSVIVSLIGTYDGAVRTVKTTVSHAIENDEQLLAHLGSMFADENWRPEGLFMVGSVGGLDTLASWLQQQLQLPVFDPPEAELALAHGAALASATDPFAAGLRSESGRRWPTVPMSMLIGGAMAFVISASVAISSQLLPERDTAVAAATAATHQEAAPKSVQPPFRKPAPPAPPAAPAPPPEAPAPAAPPVEAVQEAPLPAAEPVPAFQPDPEPVFQPAPVEQAPVAPPPPPPAVVAPPVPELPYQKPRLRDRLFDKIPGLNRLGN